MALPDYALCEVGTPITWKNTGGTYALTLTSVADAAGRQGAKGDLGQYRAENWSVLFQSSVALAATAGNQIELYWASSNSAVAGTDNPGGVSGTDATFNTTPSEYKAQLIFIGSLILSNNAGTGIQKQWFVFRPPTRYGSPVVVNSAGQALSATAANHSLTLYPDHRGVYETITG